MERETDKERRDTGSQRSWPEEGKHTPQPGDYVICLGAGTISGWGGEKGQTEQGLQDGLSTPVICSWRFLVGRLCGQHAKSQFRAGLDG